MFSIFFNSCFCLVFASITIVEVRHFYILDPDPHPPSFPDGIMRFHVDPDPHPLSFPDGIMRFHVDPDPHPPSFPDGIMRFHVFPDY